MKRNMIIVFISVLCMVLFGCGDNKIDNNAANNVIDNYGEEGFTKIKNPVVDWWKVYKDINKTNCVTLQVSNPNDFPIEFSYDLVFYKNNEVVKTETRWAMTGLDSHKAGIIYGDIKIPSSDSVDRVELENIEANIFKDSVLNSTFEKKFIDKDSQYFDAKFSDKPNYTEIWVALYNDVNKDKKIQADEFVQMGLLAPFVGIYETKGEIHIPVSSELLMFTDYEIYCFAFKRK